MSSMSLAAAYGPDRFGLSFELFPPKTRRGDEALLGHVRQLTEFRPDFVTCTYGAGGSTREKTLDIVSRVKSEFGVNVAAHLTCVGSDVEQLRSFLNDARSSAVDAIVALRGDPPRGEQSFRPVAGGLRYANELVRLIRDEFPDFGVAVAGYPEVHVEATDADSDLANLKRKVDAGADVVITQLFYDNDSFFRFRERYEAAGLRAPLVPGILPVTNLAQIQRITGMCGAKLPESFVEKLSRSEDPQWQHDVGIEYAAAQVRGLLEQGIPGLHFYVLNKSQATSSVLRAAGVRTE